MTDKARAMFESSGKIKLHTDWWMTVECCPELARYYRRAVMYNRYIFGLQAGRWGSHISVVRGEEPPRKAAWSLLDGASVPFRYGHEVLTNGKHFWLRVACPALHVVREKLGLSSPVLDFHLTVAVLCADH